MITANPEQQTTGSERANEPRRRWVLLCVIVALGLGLRMLGLAWGQGYFYFGQGDAIAAYSVAVDFGAGEERAQYIGQPNYNKHSKLPGPLWTVFCWAGLKLGGSIQGTIALIVLLNTATIVLVYVLAEMSLGRGAALWAALFAATLPSAVFYSVGVYNPDVMPFLGCLLFLALRQAISRDSARSIFWVPVLLCAMPQFHMSGLMLVPAAALVLVLSPKRLNLNWLGAGIFAGVLLYLPYFIGEARHGWQNTRGMFSPGGERFSWDGLKAITAPLNLLLNWVPQWFRTMGEYKEFGRASFGSFGALLAVNILSVAVTALLVIGIFLKVKGASSGILRAPRDAFQRSPGILLLAIVLVVPLALALVSGKPFHTRYCLVLLGPLLCLAAAAAERWMRFPRFGRWFGIGTIALCVANVWLMLGFYSYEKARIDRAAAFVPAFRKLESVYQALKARAGANGGVQIDDQDYLVALTPKDEVHRDAALIRRYVEVREKEAASKNGKPAEQTWFKLVSESELNRNNDLDVPFRGNGIALVAARPR